MTTVKNDLTKNLKIRGTEAWVALAILSVLVVGALGSIGLIARLQSNYSISQFLPKDHPLLKADLETRLRFFLDQTQPVLVTLTMKDESAGDWLSTERLVRLQAVTIELKKLDGSIGVLSLGNVPAASQEGDDLSVGTLASVANEADRRSRVRDDRFLNPLLVSFDARRTVVVVSAKDDLPSETLKALMDDTRSRLAATFPEATVSVGGVPAIQAQLSSLVKSELVRFAGLALLACCLALFAVFSSAWSVVVPFVTILLTNLFVLGFMSLMHIPMTVLAATIPILVAVTVLSLCIHTMLRFAEVAHAAPGAHPAVGSRSSAKLQIVIQTLRALFLPNLLTSLTTCFGFATLLMTDVPVIHDFGFSVSVSVMISLVVTTLAIGPLLALLPVPNVRRWVSEEATWAAVIFRRRGLIVGGVIALCAAMGFFGRELHWSARLFDDLPKHEEARHATDEIDRSLGGSIPFEIVIAHEGANEPWNDPAALVTLDRVLTRLRVFTEVGSAVGLPDLLRFSNGKPTAALPATRSAIAESWFVISMAEDSPLKKFLTSDGSTTRLSLRLRDVAGDRLESAMSRMQAYVQNAFPDAKVSVAGMATTVHRLNNGVSRSLLLGFWEALAVISILLLIVFRSLRWTLTAVLPNLVPAAVLVGTLALVGTPMKPGVALVFSIALGIAFNNTVYLLQRLRSLMGESGRGPAEEIERALKLEGNPCLVASLCLLAGFGTFLLSQFGINQTFGAYMLISLFFGLIGDLAFLPALIRLCPWILASKNAEPALNIIPGTRTVSEEEMSADSREGAFQPRAAATIVAALMTALMPTAHAEAAPANDANSILKHVELGLTSKDERALIKMKVVESNGSAKEREVEIKRKSGGKNQVLVRLKSPSDVSGVALLSVSQGSSEDQWLYMPSQKKARRVVSGNKSQRFLDTEFNLEDFSASTYARFENKLVGEERAPSAAVAVIESKSKGGESSYSKIKTWVDLATYQVQKSEYYDKDGKLLKTMVFRDYKQFGTAWRAQTVEVRNMQTQRSTILKIAGMKLNSGLNDREFTQSALEQED